jgi:hypothetical protein
MKISRTSFSLLIPFLLASLVFSQQEKLHTDDAVAVQVNSRPAAPRGLTAVAQEQAASLVEQLADRPHYVHVVAKHADGTVFADFITHNLRTTGGADWQASVMGNTSTQPASSNYIALTNDGGAPAAGDCGAGSTTCTLTSEVSTNGLARAQGTYAHSSGTSSWTLTHTWTATGAQSVQKAGMFNATSSGTLVFEASFSSVTLASSDTLTVTWTVSI